MFRTNTLWNTQEMSLMVFDFATRSRPFFCRTAEKFELFVSQCVYVCVRLCGSMMMSDEPKVGICFIHAI